MKKVNLLKMESQKLNNDEMGSVNGGLTIRIFHRGFSIGGGEGMCTCACQESGQWAGVYNTSSRAEEDRGSDVDL